MAGNQINMEVVGQDINKRLTNLETTKLDAEDLGDVGTLDLVDTGHLAKQMPFGAVEQDTHRQVGQATAPNEAAFAQYTGIVGQIVVNLETKNLHVLDGTAGSVGSIFLNRDNADKRYLGKADKAAGVDWDNVDGKPDPIIKTGGRGTLAGFETPTALTGNQTIDKAAGDTIALSTSGAVTLTFTPAAATESCTKIIDLTAAEATTLAIAGAEWANGEEAPTWGTAGKHLTITAHFIGGRVDLYVLNNNEE